MIWHGTACLKPRMPNEAALTSQNLKSAGAGIKQTALPRRNRRAAVARGGAILGLAARPAHHRHCPV
jgi:hypothetical protein